MIPVAPVTVALFEAAIEYEPNTGCWLWARGAKSDGRGMFSAGRRDLRMSAPHFAHQAFKGPVPAGQWVLHHCDTPACVNPAHLFLGTQVENMADMARKGRGVGPRLHGDANGRATITAEDVLAFRRRVAAGEKQRVVGAEFGLSPTAAWKIAHRVTWKHLTAAQDRA